MECGNQQPLLVRLTSTISVPTFRGSELKPGGNCRAIECGIMGYSVVLMDYKVLHIPFTAVQFALYEMPPTEPIGYEPVPVVVAEDITPRTLEDATVETEAGPVTIVAEAKPAAPRKRKPVKKTRTRTRK